MMRLNRLKYLALMIAAHPAAAFAVEHAGQHVGEHAAEHGAHHAAGPESLIWPTVNFIIYALLMRYFFKRFASPALRARAAHFEEHSQRAARVLADADREFRNLETRLNGIVEEQRAIRERLATEGAQIAAQVMAQAEQSANALRRDIGRRIERELHSATSEVKQQVIARATELARAQLRTELSSDDDFRLRQDAIRSLL